MAMFNGPLHWFASLPGAVYKIRCGWGHQHDAVVAPLSREAFSTVPQFVAQTASISPVFKFWEGLLGRAGAQATSKQHQNIRGWELFCPTSASKPKKTTLGPHTGLKCLGDGPSSAGHGRNCSVFSAKVARKKHREATGKSARDVAPLLKCSVPS